MQTGEAQAALPASRQGKHFAGRLGGFLSFYPLFRKFMNRSILIALLLSALTGCVNDPNTPHRNPPKDPQDYHGVPTDDRPPMLIAPAPPQ